MKVNDLRVGNWVQFDNCVPAQMALADFSDWYNDHNSHEFGNYIHPIPLTEEWLLKFGFVKGHSSDGDFFSHYKWPFIVYWDGERLSTTFWQGNEKRYVHQLQNLYWCLCGEELEIN